RWTTGDDDICEERSFCEPCGGNRGRALTQRAHRRERSFESGHPRTFKCVSRKKVRASAGRAFRVREYLTSVKQIVITCRPEDTIETAATLLASNHICAMPVRDRSGRIIGMLSDRDIVRAFSQPSMDVGRCLVGDLMSAEPIVCTPEHTMLTAR